jgi:hypothetical protein
VICRAMGWTYPDVLALPVEVYGELVAWLTEAPE